MFPLPRPIHRPTRGFTLIELMITVAVVAILAAVALPAYNESVRKSRRSEGIAALMAVQQAQERWRGNHSEYAPSVTAAATDAPPGLGLPGVTAGGYYAISLAGVSATGYTATATAQDGTSQAADTDCVKLSVRMADGNLTYAGAALSYAGTNLCWAK